MKSRPAKILELKGATLTVLTVNTCTDDLQQLAGALMELTGGAPDFFDYDAAVLDFSSLETPGEQAPNWLIARGVFARHRLNLFAVRAAPTAWQESATAAGLSWIVEAEVLRPARPSTQKTVKPDATKETEAITASPGHAEGAQNADATKRQLDLNFQAKADQAENSESAGAAGPVRPAVKEKTLAQVNVVAGRAEEAPVTLSRPTTLVIDKPLRSGQRVYARDADLVVMAAVNAGAEVIADGNIHVYAPLRGRALAGAHGDESARILTTCFEAELVSIAGVYSTFEPGFPVGVFGGAAQVQLKVAGETESGEGEKTTLRVVPLKH